MILHKIRDDVRAAMEDGITNLCLSTESEGGHSDVEFDSISEPALVELYDTCCNEIARIEALERDSSELRSKLERTRASLRRAVGALSSVSGCFQDVGLALSDASLVLDLEFPRKK